MELHGCACGDASVPSDRVQRQELLDPKSMTEREVGALVRAHAAEAKAGSDYPRRFGPAKTARLVEPLGAWLGQLLVSELGGEWVPRTKLEENQVVVGRIAFLPFLRVEHYLASKQAVLEYSLTQYFAAAKRAKR
jgi:hypothetical protein